MFRFLKRKDIRKTILYRVLSIASRYIIVYALTGSIEIATVVAIVCLISHTALYYLVERLVH